MRLARRAIVAYRAREGLDAIDEHSRRLAGALRATGIEVEYVSDGLASGRRAARGAEWLLLQYNPFAYGRAGFAPRLVRDALALRRATRPRLAVIVHEPWIDVVDWRSALIGRWQRLQLRSLLAAADVVMASTQAIVRQIDAEAVLVPVGSNITPIATTAEAARAELGFADELVVALFGRRNPSRALDHAEAAITALAAARGARRLTVLNLGADAPLLDVAPKIDVRTPGRLDAAAVSLHLRASDILLLPLTDGVSTRRTTLMAGLAHGVPVLGLRGVNTDGPLLDHPLALTLTPAADPRAFARAAVDLTADLDRLRAVGAAGRRLYEEQFDWPVVAQRVTSLLDAISSHAAAAR